MVSNGILLGWEGNKRHWFNKDGHILTIAKTGAGKNTSCIIPNLLTTHFEGSKIILDLKAQNAAICSYWKEEEGVGKAYRINPWGDFNMPSIKYNPFCLLDTENDTLLSDCNAMAEAIIGDIPKGDTEHFYKHAKNFITVYLMYKVVEDPENTPNPAELYYDLSEKTRSSKELKKLCVSMRNVVHWDFHIKKAIEIGANDMEAFCMAGDNGEFRGVATTISGAFSCFKEKALAKVVNTGAEQSLKLLDFLFERKQSNDLYICLPQDEVEFAQVWLRLLLRSFTRYLKTNRPKNKVLFVLDELPQLGRFSPLIKDAAFLRDYGVRFWFIGQSISQFKESYGEEGMQTLIQNCSVKQFFNVEDDTAKYVSEKLGKNTIIIKDFETSEYKSQFVEDLMSRAEIEQTDKIITFIAGKKPELLEKKHYFQIPILNKRAKPNPYFHGEEAFKFSFY